MTGIMRSLGWTVVEIGAGLAAGYGAYAIMGDLWSALVWCAVAASIIGYMEGSMS